jgi:hypothetical protein
MLLIPICLAAGGPAVLLEGAPYLGGLVLLLEVAIAHSAHDIEVDSFAGSLFLSYYPNVVVR